MNSRFYNEDRRTSSLPPSMTAAGGADEETKHVAKALKPQPSLRLKQPAQASNAGPAGSTAGSLDR